MGQFAKACGAMGGTEVVLFWEAREMKHVAILLELLVVSFGQGAGLCQEAKKPSGETQVSAAVPGTVTQFWDRC